MFDAKRCRRLRNWVIAMIALLAVQYEFGMAFNISDPPHLTPFGFSYTEFNNALNRVGPVAQAHAGLGVVAGIVAIVVLILSLRSGRRWVQILGTLAFLTILVAGIMGQLFVQSGYQNDNYTHGMATFFILSFIFSFLELYVLKPQLESEASHPS